MQNLKDLLKTKMPKIASNGWHKGCTLKKFEILEYTDNTTGEVNEYLCLTHVTSSGAEVIDNRFINKTSNQIEFALNGFREQFGLKEKEISMLEVLKLAKITPYDIKISQNTYIDALGIERRSRNILIAKFAEMLSTTNTKAQASNITVTVASDDEIDTASSIAF